MQNDRQRPQPVHRQNGMSRRALENGFSTISVLLLLILLAIGTGFLIFFPRSKQSVIEKRELATFPNFSFASYFKGEFTSGVTNWYDDTVPYRDDFKNMGNNIKGLFGITTNDTAVIIGKPVKPVKNNSDSSKSETSKSDTTSKSDNSTTSQSEETSEKDQKDFRQEEAEGGYENGMLIINQDGHWRGLELFGNGSGNNLSLIHI